jgi:CHAT domain-containing protein
MENLETLIAELSRISEGDTRKTFVREHPVMSTVEGARVLCRTSVALTARDFVAAERLCEALDEVVELSSVAATKGYRDHAWAAYSHQVGSDYRKAVALWLSAINNFESAGLTYEAAITSSCAIVDLDLMGEYERLRQCETRARSCFEANSDRLRLARLGCNVAQCLLNRGDLKGGTSMMEAAYMDLAGTSYASPDHLTLLSNLGTCYLEVSDLARATFLLEKAATLCRVHGFHTTLVRTYDNLAYVKLVAGDLASALELIEQQSQRLSAHPDTHLSCAAARTEAEVLLDIGLPMQAHWRAIFAYQKFRELGLEVDAAKALLVAARSLTARGRIRQAMGVLEEANALFSAVGAIQGCRRCDLEKARLLLMIGEVDSCSVLLSALLSYETTSLTDIALGGRLLQARLLYSKGELTQARNVCEEARARCELLGFGTRENEALGLLGEIYFSAGELDRAQTVLEAYRRSIDVLRRNLPTPELRTAFLSEKSDLFQTLFTLSVRSGAPPQRLFALAEASKSRALLESLVLRLDDPSPASPDLSESALLELLEGLRTAQKHMNRLTGTSLRTLVAPIRDNVQAAEKAARHLLRSDTDADAEQPTLAEVLHELPRGCALVEFYIAHGILFAILASDRTRRIYDLGSADYIRRICRLTLFSLQRAHPSGVAQPQDALLFHLRQLYECLWTKIAPDLECSRLVIVPHGFLHGFPFHALFDGNDFLVDRHAITYAPSASIFYLSRKRESRSYGGSVVVGLYDDAAPSIAEEVRDVANILPKSKVFLNGSATRERLLPELPEASIIHIASHGGFDVSNPHCSGLRLEDGPLTVGYLQEMSLAADLVVLSGCETGRAALRGCDDLVGFTQAVLQAGARSALVTLWRVEDRTTAVFMKTFHRRLIDQVARDESLRLAMILQKESFPHPTYWAPFVLVGDPGGGDDSSDAEEVVREAPSPETEAPKTGAQ